MFPAHYQTRQDGKSINPQATPPYSELASWSVQCARQCLQPLACSAWHSCPCDQLSLQISSPIKPRLDSLFTEDAIVVDVPCSWLAGHTVIAAHRSDTAEKAMPPWSQIEASVDVVCRLHQRINDVYDVNQIDVVVVGIFHQVGALLCPCHTQPCPGLNTATPICCGAT